MHKVYIYADPGLLIEKIDPQSGNYYRAREVDAHLAALQAQHAEALAEKDRLNKEIVKLRDWVVANGGTFS